jgi:hypothetical protein
MMKVVGEPNTEVVATVKILIDSDDTSSLRFDVDLEPL